MVQTYTKAGVENGYFATSEDTEIFDHELTWMLLNQVRRRHPARGQDSGPRRGPPRRMESIGRKAREELKIRALRDDGFTWTSADKDMANRPSRRGETSWRGSLTTPPTRCNG